MFVLCSNYFWIKEEQIQGNKGGVRESDFPPKRASKDRAKGMNGQSCNI